MSFRVNGKRPNVCLCLRLRVSACMGLVQNRKDLRCVHLPPTIKTLQHWGKNVGMSTTDLISAINQQDISQVKQLIRERVDVDVLSFHGETALQLSIRTYQKEICQLLLKAKANPNFQNPTNRTTPLHSIFEGHGRVGLEKFIMFAWLLMKYANTNAKDINGNTPLHEAAKHGSLYCVEELLEKRADCRIVHNFSLEPLYYAVHSGIFRENVVSLLMRAGSDIDKKYLMEEQCSTSSLR